ncbi:MAG: hypothetical protein U0163_05000 [Gemmatimonadaceae bacterium]
MLDNVAPLRQASPQIFASAAHVFTPSRRALRARRDLLLVAQGRTNSRDARILDSTGTVLRTFRPDTTKPDTTRQAGGVVAGAAA